MREPFRWTGAVVLLLLSGHVISGCDSSTNDAKGAAVDPVSCTGDPVGANCSNGQALTVAEVQQIIVQAVEEAEANSVDNATIAVVDRVNNVLAVWQMAPDPDPLNPSERNLAVIGNPQPEIPSGLVGLEVPNALAAISKAGTASFLSSQGNAFSTRTASQIIQQNFNPGEDFRPGGPLFGVQFSQLPCNDFSERAYDEPQRGPKRLPLGFAADSGALPLYKKGVMVGAVAVEFDGVYDADPDVLDVSSYDLEERATVAASSCFEAPASRRANHVTIDGRALRFIEDDNIRTVPDCEHVPFFPPSGSGELVPITGWYGNFLPDGITPDGDPDVRPGTPLIDPLTNASGFQEVAIDSFYQPDSERCVINGVDFGAGVCATVLVDPDAPGVPTRFPPSPSTEPSVSAGGLVAVEVQEILYRVLKLAERTRAQVRLPIGEAARINVAVVDKAGEVLGVARSRDALIFSLHLALQKAQTAVFFSDQPFENLQNVQDPLIGVTPDLPLPPLNTKSFASYGTALDRFFDGTHLPSGTAFSATAVGALAQPFYPSGQNNESEGPLSRNIESWSVFSTGFQVDSILAQTASALCRQVPQIREILALLFPTVLPEDPATCPDPATVQSCTLGSELAQIDLGPTIFSGGFPIYRLEGTGPVLIGAVGVSGDGIEQDNVIAMVGLADASQSATSSIAFGHAPPEIRVNTLYARGVRPRYSLCAVAPFLGSDEQDACEGL